MMTEAYLIVVGMNIEHWLALAVVGLLALAGVSAAHDERTATYGFLWPPLSYSASVSGCGDDGDA